MRRDCRVFRMSFLTAPYPQDDSLAEPAQLALVVERDMFAILQDCKILQAQLFSAGTCSHAWEALARVRLDHFSDFKGGIGKRVSTSSLHHRPPNQA